MAITILLNSQQQAIYDRFNQLALEHKSTQWYLKKDTAKKAFLAALEALFISFPINNRSGVIARLSQYGEYPVRAFKKRLKEPNEVLWSIRGEIHTTPGLMQAALEFQNFKSNFEVYKQSCEQDYLSAKGRFIEEFGSEKMKQVKQAIQIVRC